MKKLTLYKHASDTAFSLVGKSQLDVDTALTVEFQKAGFDQSDYNYWKQSACQCLATFNSLAQLNAPSVKPVAQVPVPLVK